MQLKHFLLALLCISLWGINYPLLKIMVQELPPIFSTAIRLSLMGSCVFFVKTPKKDWRKIIILSCSLFTLTLAPTALAIKHVDASIAALLNELEVPFAALLSYLFLKEKLNLIQAGGMALAFIGVYIIAKSPEVPYNDLTPVILLVLAAFFYGFSAILIKFIKNIDAMSLTVWTAFFASPQLFLLSFSMEHEDIKHIELLSNKVIFVVILSATLSLYSFYLWNRLIQLYKVNQIVPFGMLIPVSSLIFSYYLLGETTHFIALLGGCLTLLGVWLQSHKNSNS